VALAGVDVNLPVDGFAVSVDDVFALESVVFLKRIVCPKPVGIGGQRLLLAGSQQESNRRSVRRFCGHYVALAGITIDQNERGGLCSSRFLIGPTPARGQTTRARRSVALTAFLIGSNAHLIDLDRINEIEGGRVQRLMRTLDALVDGLVGNVDFLTKLV
jgi:hypothetical protein